MDITKLLLSSLFVLSVVSCGGNDDESNAKKNNNANENKNIPTIGLPKEITRLEFPKIKGGENLIVVHKTDDLYGVNYSIEWDCKKKSQRWSCYQMHEGYKGKAGRWSQYEEDPDIPSQYTWDRDYFYRSGYDHGHICPSADRQYSKKANRQTFYLSNMQPQRHIFNVGIWEKMENQIRIWTNKFYNDTLYIAKGGTIDKENQIIGRIKGKLIIPKFFYMAVLKKNQQGYTAMAFWAENLNEDHTSDKLGDYVINIKELERRTGIDFFCNLPDEIEKRIESMPVDKIKNAWGLH